MKKIIPILGVLIIISIYFMSDNKQTIEKSNNKAREELKRKKIAKENCRRSLEDLIGDFNSAQAWYDDDEDALIKIRTNASEQEQICEEYGYKEDFSKLRKKCNEQLK